MRIFFQDEKFLFCTAGAFQGQTVSPEKWIPVPFYQFYYCFKFVMHWLFIFMKIRGDLVILLPYLMQHILYRYYGLPKKG